MEIVNAIVSGVVTVILAVIGFLQIRAKLRVDFVEESAVNLKTIVEELKAKLVTAEKRIDDCEKDRHQLRIEVEVTKRVAELAKNVALENSDDPSGLMRKFEGGPPSGKHKPN